MDVGLTSRVRHQRGGPSRQTVATRSTANSAPTASQNGNQIHWSKASRVTIMSAKCDTNATVP